MALVYLCLGVVADLSTALPIGLPTQSKPPSSGRFDKWENALMDMIIANLWCLKGIVLLVACLTLFLLFICLPIVCIAWLYPDFSEQLDQTNESSSNKVTDGRSGYGTMTYEDPQMADERILPPYMHYTDDHCPTCEERCSLIGRRVPLSDVPEENEYSEDEDCRSGNDADDEWDYISRRTIHNVRPPSQPDVVSVFAIGTENDVDVDSSDSGSLVNM